MKKRLRKNQLIITSLAIMIAVAGYLNFTNTVKVSKTTQAPAESKASDDVAALDIADDIAEETVSDKVDDEIVEEKKEEAGEAVLTQAAVREYVAGARLDREQSHSKTKETLNEIINNDSLEEDSKKEAIEELARLTREIEYENSIEQLLASKGYENAVVSIGDNTVDVVLDFDELSESQRAQIEDIIVRKTGYAVSQIVISRMQGTKS